MDWIAETMPKRADWAYKETRALVEHMLRDRVPPEHLPGSIYGAVGLCQFMPSNIATYGADGDGDGRVDLFTVPDAVASLSHYLARHGWKAGLSSERQEAPKCTLMAATAITKAIEDVTGVKVGIKWPNDVLYEGKKLVGILTEMNAEMDCINYIIIGMGINVNIDKEEMPEEIQNIATSLSQITGKKISRLKLLNKILYYLEHLYIICQEEGFAPILNEWRKYSITLNQHIRVIGTNEVLEGIAVDIDDDGALLVNIDGQIKRVLAGDVSIRPVQNR